MPSLADIYSAIDSAKRRATDLVKNPLTSLEQMVGYGIDRAKEFDELSQKATDEWLATKSFRGPYQNQLSDILAEAYNPVGMTVWHGSPHKFDRFDASKIGTGEGAQAYGHGLYFAESPKVAREYQRALAGVDVRLGSTPLDEIIAKGGNEADAARRLKAEFASNAYGTADELLSPAWWKEAERVHRSGVTAQSGGIAKLLDKYGGISAAKPGGSIYKVDLPDEQIAKMLDWDKPLSQQPKEVQEFAKLKDPNLASKEPHFVTPRGEIIHWTDLLNSVEDLTNPKMKTIAPKIYGGGEWVEYGNHMMGKTTGGDFYRSLSSPTEWSRQASVNTGKVGLDDMEASAALREAGIPGIRYLDQGSRGAGQGTSNFVVFPGNEELLKILERNNQPLK
jgi:hypothetical protein